MQDSEQGWNLDQIWRDRISGVSCELCSVIGADSATSSEGYKVADLRVSRWILGRNQYIRGYSLLVLNTHAIELHDLVRPVRERFVEDIALAGATLNRVLSPIKINIEMQGNVIPHLHCHIKPRFLTDRPGHARIFQNGGRVELLDSEYSQMVLSLREAISHP